MHNEIQRKGKTKFPGMAEDLTHTAIGMLWEATS